MIRETDKKQIKSIKSQITVVTKGVKTIASEVSKMKVQIDKFAKKFHIGPENEIKATKITDKLVFSFIDDKYNMLQLGLGQIVDDKLSRPDPGER